MLRLPPGRHTFEYHLTLSIHAGPPVSYAECAQSRRRLAALPLPGYTAFTLADHCYRHRGACGTRAPLPCSASAKTICTGVRTGKRGCQAWRFLWTGIDVPSFHLHWPGRTCPRGLTGRQPLNSTLSLDVVTTYTLPAHPSFRNVLFAGACLGTIILPEHGISPMALPLRGRHTGGLTRVSIAHTGTGREALRTFSPYAPRIHLAVRYGVIAQGGHHLFETNPMAP